MVCVLHDEYEDVDTHKTVAIHPTDLFTSLASVAPPLPPQKILIGPLKLRIFFYFYKYKTVFDASYWYQLGEAGMVYRESTSSAWGGAVRPTEAQRSPSHYEPTPTQRDRVRTLYEDMTLCEHGVPAVPIMSPGAGGATLQAGRGGGVH